MVAHVLLAHTVQVRALVSQQNNARNDPQREVTCFGCRVIAGSSPVYATKNGCEVKWLRCQLVTLFGAGSTPVTSAKIVI